MTESRPLVGIDATPLFTGHRIRGIGRYLGGVLEALATTDPVWATRNIGVLLARDQPAPFDAAQVWRTRRSKWRPQDIDPIIAAFTDRLAIRRARPRLWHHTDPTIPYGPVAPERTIVTVYDLIPLQVPEVMAAIRPHRRFAYRRYIELIRQARGVIAISETTREAVTRLLGVERGRIYVVPPSVPQGPAADVRNPAAGRPGQHANEFVFVGVPDPHKRPELAIDTIAELVRRGRDAELTMVGLHPPSIRSRLTQRARTSGIDDRVRFVDRIDDAALTALYRRATTLALSSVEGFGLPPVEAILAGGRVVATPTEAYRETMSGHVVFADAAEPGAVADAVERAVDTGAGANDTTALVARYSPQTVAVALRRAYDELAAG